MKDFWVGFAGGVVGAGVLAAAVGASGYYHWKQMGAFLPTVLEFTTSQGSKFYAYAYLSCKKGSKTAKIVIPPFALVTAGATLSATSGPILGGAIPLSLTPIGDSTSLVVSMYSKDTSNFITGKASFNKTGSVVITADQPSGTGEAWGLAREIAIEYPVA
jgi:hypothetical protein